MMVFNVMPEAKIQFRVEKKIFIEKEKGKKLTKLYDSSQNVGLIVSIELTLFKI